MKTEDIYLPSVSAGLRIKHVIVQGSTFQIDFDDLTTVVLHEEVFAERSVVHASLFSDSEYLGVLVRDETDRRLSIGVDMQSVRDRDRFLSCTSCILGLGFQSEPLLTLLDIAGRIHPHLEKGAPIDPALGSLVPPWLLLQEKGTLYRLHYGNRKTS